MDKGFSNQLSIILVFFYQTSVINLNIKHFILFKINKNQKITLF